MKLTTAAYYRPSGKNIHRFPDSKDTDTWGVMPDAGYDLRLSDHEQGLLLTDRQQRDILRPHPAAGQHAAAPGSQASKNDTTLLPSSARRRRADRDGAARAGLGVGQVRGDLAGRRTGGWKTRKTRSLPRHAGPSPRRSPRRPSSIASCRWPSSI